MKTKNKIIAIFISLAFFLPLISCNTNELKRGDSYQTIWNYFEEKNITPMVCLDFLLFEENQRAYVIQRSDDYRTIKKIRNYPLVTRTKESYTIYFAGMDLFQITENFGLPTKIYPVSPSFIYTIDDKNHISMTFFSDDNHLLYAL